MIQVSPSISLYPTLAILIIFGLFSGCVSSSSSLNRGPNIYPDHPINPRNLRHLMYARQRRSHQPKMGQLETFNFKATGLGDLEASDALKKMSRRSVGTIFAFDNDNNYQLNDLRPLMEKRRKSIVRKLNRRDPLGRVVDLRALIENGKREQQAVEAARNLFKYHRISSRDVQAINAVENKEPQLYTLQRVLPPKLEPIILTRRTEEQIDPSVEPNVDDDQAGKAANQHLDFQEEQPTAGSQNYSPTVGEFGSKVSLLTTRKIQPNSVDNFDIIATYGGQEFNEEDTSVEESEPISSQLMINLRPNLRASTTEKSLEDRVRNEGIKKPNADEQPDDTPSVDRTNQNYLPRIARAPK